MKIYIVSSKFDSYIKYPYLAVFDNYEDALRFKDAIFDRMDPFYRERFYGWVIIEEQEVNAVNPLTRTMFEGVI